MKLRPQIKAISAYKPPLSGRARYPGLPLDFNERTIPTPAATARALERFIKAGKLQMYPDYGELEARIADYVGVASPDKIMVANGSDQAIDIIFRTYGAGGKLIIPTPSFVMFKHSARLAGGEIVAPAYDRRDMAFPFERVMDAIDADTDIVVICNPNNPTGGAVEIERVKAIASKARDALVCVDEAYYEFSKLTAAALLDEFPNLVITRTFSKAFGLASLRVGYCVANEAIIEQLVKVRGPYAVSALAHCAATAALEDVGAVESYADEVMNSAKPLVERFFDDIGVERFESAANFILARVPNADAVARKLVENGALVRPRGGPGIEDTLRITIGTTAQMRDFIQIYKKALEL